MWCGKEVRVPSQWAALSKEILKEKVDPELLDIDGMIKWIVECDVADESTVRAYEKKIKPYHFVRLVFPIIPKDKLCFEACKIFLHYVVALYCYDDRLETECDRDDMEKVCNAYDSLDEKIDEMFPRIPTVKEMQCSLKYLSESKLIAPVVMGMDFVNKVTSSILKFGNYSEAVVLEFRRRFSNIIALYLRGVQMEKKISIKNMVNKIWRRLFNAAPLSYEMYVEISSFSLGKVKEHIPTIVEMSVVSSLVSIFINDLYSYQREVQLPDCDNLMIQWLNDKVISSMPEAVEKVTRILNASMQYMFEKVERVKLDYPNSPEAHVLYEYLAYTAVGWIYLHEKTNGRYKDSPWRISLTDVEDDKVQEWLACKDSYGFEIINQFLAKSNQTSKRIIDALGGNQLIRSALIDEND